MPRLNSMYGLCQARCLWLASSTHLVFVGWPGLGLGHCQMFHKKDAIAKYAPEVILGPLQA